MSEIYNYILVEIIGFLGGLFVMWVYTRKEPEKQIDDSNSSAYLDMDEWKEYIKECPYYTVIKPDSDLEENMIKSKKKKRKK